MAKQNYAGYLLKLPKAPAVTQAMLAEYAQLVEAARLKKELRQHLIALLDAGAGVEPGPLKATLDVSTQVRCTWPKLIDLLGEEEVEAIREQIEPTEVRYLRVKPVE